jgi:hypothetical protein
MYSRNATSVFPRNATSIFSLANQYGTPVEPNIRPCKEKKIPCIVPTNIETITNLNKYTIETKKRNITFSPHHAIATTHAMLWQLPLLCFPTSSLKREYIEFENTYCVEIS